MREITKATIIGTLGLAAVLLVAAAGGVTHDAQASEMTRFAEDRYFVSVSDITSTKASERMRHESEKARAAEVAKALDSFKEAEEIESAPAEIESTATFEAESYLGEPYYTETNAYAPTDGLTREGGVNYFDGRNETYYSSQILYHHNTPEWTLDDEGFYRDSEGRYVVAASDKAQGETFEGSKGECIVLDTGCAPGVTDYDVGW
ncbi:MAG: hypothetical protein IJ087_07525 [Eggerthellaceae bacterium]|nr:hypothetical protein [Eggerthellaceae bacterium]